MAIDLSAIGKAIGEGLANMGSYSAQAAAQSNAISAAAQSAQGAFNQNSANLANAQNLEAMTNQYAFNSAQASMANQFTESMWQRSADWNEEMWQRQADFNAEQAQIQRDWQERMANTQYQRAVGDMEKAGLNPILAVTGGGVGTSVPSGATASVGGSSMGSAQGVMASGGLLGANSASESNYMGQMEQLSGTLGLISACIGGLSQAAGSAGWLGEAGEGIMDYAQEMLNPSGEINFNTAVDIAKNLNPIGNLSKYALEALEKGAKWVKNKVTGKNEKVIDQHTLDNVRRTQQRMDAYNRFKTEPKG